MSTDCQPICNLLLEYDRNSKDRRVKISAVASQRHREQESMFHFGFRPNFLTNRPRIVGLFLDKAVSTSIVAHLSQRLSTACLLPVFECFGHSCEEFVSVLEPSLVISGPFARFRFLRTDGWSMMKKDRRRVSWNEEYEVKAQWIDGRRSDCKVTRSSKFAWRLSDCYRIGAGDL
jgi:hypothetical protein